MIRRMAWAPVVAWALAGLVGLPSALAQDEGSDPAVASDEVPKPEEDAEADTAEARLEPPDLETPDAGLRLDAFEPSMAENAEPEPVVAEAESTDADTEDRSGDFAAIPGIFYSQETSLGFAGVLSYAFYPEPLPSESERSRILFLATYTIRNQLSVQVRPSFYLDDNGWIIQADYEFTQFPDRFWDIGNESPNEYQDYTERFGEFETDVRLRVLPRVWVGLGHEAWIYTVTETGQVFDSGDEVIDRPPILDDSIPGRDGGFTNGFGLSFLFDSRDDPYVPQRGTYIMTSEMVFNGVFGSRYDFTRWVVDVRQLIPVVPRLRHRLALQLYSELRSGDPPFFNMSELGGDELMRGFYEGRFRDRHILALQAEYRFPIIWRFEGAVFGDVGEVYGREPFDFEDLVWSAGGGLRFLFGRSLIVRLDVGAGPEAFGVTLDVGYPF